MLRYNTVSFIVKDFKIINNWPTGLVHFKDDFISKTFGEWIEFRQFEIMILHNDTKEFLLGFKKKFNLDINIMIDPFSLTPQQIDQNQYHFGASKIRLGQTFTFD